jgi:hypothetical protein
MSARLLGSACLVALVACSGGDGGSIDAQPVDAPVDAFAIPALRNPLSTPTPSWRPRRPRSSPSDARAATR